MKFSSTSKKGGTTINVTPLIDVVFLLLIFVLLAAKLEPDPGVNINAPEGKSNEEQKSDVFVLSITRDGKMFFNSDPVTLEQLPERIRKMREENKDPVIAINADEAAYVKYFGQAVDIIRRNKQEKFFFRFRQASQ